MLSTTNRPLNCLKVAPTRRTLSGVTVLPCRCSWNWLVVMWLKYRQMAIKQRAFHLKLLLYFTTNDCYCNYFEAAWKIAVDRLWACIYNFSCAIINYFPCHPRKATKQAQGLATRNWAMFWKSPGSIFSGRKWRPPDRPRISVVYRTNKLRT